MLLSILFCLLSWTTIAISASHAFKSKTCIVASKYASSNGTDDDSPAVAKALADCATNGIIQFKLGVDYNVLSPISATNLSNVDISMLGNLHLPQNITAVQTLVNASDGTLYWFKFSGASVNYIGTPNVTTGWIYSYGQQWWDANPTNGTGTAARPHLISFNTTNGSFHYFKSRKPIGWNVALSGTNITATNAIIDAVSNSSSFPFNTDGFDVQGNNITITDSLIYNGDDAIAVQTDSHNILFARNTIGYQSHGMSIGSLGQNQAAYADVSNITFDTNTVISAVYAARFKSWEGGQGLAKNITWSNIKVYNVTFPIYVTQTYTNQGSTQTQIENGAVSERPNNSSVVMENFNWVNFTGTINTFKPGDGSCVTDPCWYDVGLPDLKHTEAIIIECNTQDSCSDFRTETIELWPESLASPTVVCINATDMLNPELGFDCANGTFIPFS